MIYALEQKLDYIFQDRTLYTRALTHRSANQENNERLEFLGDAVLGLIIGEILFSRYPEAKEGQLSRLRADLVQKSTLAEIGAELELGDALILGAGELKSGGRSRASILASGVEALLGAVFIDSDIDTSEKVVRRIYGDRLLRATPAALHKDPKTALQEFLQKKRTPLPSYKVLNAMGKAHAMKFRVECHVCSLPSPTVGEGSSHRQAEQQAAKLALGRLHVGY